MMAITTSNSTRVKPARRPSGRRDKSTNQDVQDFIAHLQTERVSSFVYDHKGRAKPNCTTRCGNFKRLRRLEAALLLNRMKGKDTDCRRCFLPSARTHRAVRLARHRDGYAIRASFLPTMSASRHRKRHRALDRELFQKR